MAKGMVTTSDLAAHFRCSEDTVRRLAREKRIPYIMLRGTYRFDVDEVVAALRRQERERETGPSPARST